MDEQSINDTMDPSSIYKLKSFDEKPADVEKETKFEEGILLFNMNMILFLFQIKIQAHLHVFNI